MMGRQAGDQSQLFYLFNLEERIPANHLLRRINPVVTRVLAELREKLAPFYSDIGRPSIDPELMIRMLMVAPLGMIVSYAVLGGMPETDLFKEMRDNIEKSPAVRCFTMHTYDHMEEPRREAMARAVELIGSGKVRPAIAARIPFAEARRAHELIEQRSAMGKIVLTP